MSCVPTEIFKTVFDFCLVFRRTGVGRYGYISHEPPDYINILPEDNRLAEVSSNIWGTKFKILGVNLDHVPSLLGQVNVFDLSEKEERKFMT